MHADDISVVIPTCDRPEFVRQAVACVLGQSLPPSQVIVVDNGRETPGLSEFADRICVHTMDYRAGVARARNFGAKAASAAYVAFLDDDDLWERDYLRKVAEVIRAERPDCVICRLDKLEAGQVQSYKNAAGEVNVDTLLVRNPGVGGQNIVVRREAFLEVCGFDAALRTGEDKSLALELLVRNYTIVTAPHIQAIKREHDTVRLSDAESLATGISQFLSKYQHMMTSAQRSVNQQKIARYRKLASRER